MNQKYCRFIKCLYEYSLPPAGCWEEGDEQIRETDSEREAAQDAGEELSRHLYQRGGQEDASLGHVAVACGL